MPAAARWRRCRCTALAGSPGAARHRRWLHGGAAAGLPAVDRAGHAGGRNRRDHDDARLRDDDPGGRRLGASVSFAQPAQGCRVVDGCDGTRVCRLLVVLAFDPGRLRRHAQSQLRGRERVLAVGACSPGRGGQRCGANGTVRALQCAGCPVRRSGRAGRCGAGLARELHRCVSDDGAARDVPALWCDRPARVVALSAACRSRCRC